MSTVVLLLAGAFAAASAAEDQADGLQAARKLLLAGKYAESDEAYGKLREEHPVEAAVGLAGSLSSRGKTDEAAALLAETLLAHPQAAVLHAELARLAFDRGDHGAAENHVAAALALDAESLPARWLEAELHRVSGRLAEAEEGYKWFVEYYNGHEIDSPDDLRLIGQAAAQFARWRRLSNQFTFLVNELYPDALELEAVYWPAHYEAGLLYLEKYNQAEASRELKHCLELNPNAAEAHAALGELALQNYELDDARRSIERALDINPRLAEAHRLKADLRLANFQAAEAVEVLEQARQLNPLSEKTLGRLAAAWLVVDGPVGAEGGGRWSTLVDEVNARNPHAGEFYLAMAGAFDLTRKYPQAARYYQEAVERMPQLVEPRSALGLMYMRLGDEAAAQKLLDEAFQIDPFNVRVSNSLKVLEVLSGYAVLETEHFVIKFDRGHDELLAHYASRYLEQEVYPELVARFGFEPQGKSLFEIFSRARNTNGHGWFSARMVGLPYVGTVGACAGKIVALASPNDMPKKYNWARVLKHEFVHVLNLQQTDFNIPHWFTEALAVESEGYPRPQVWNELLAQRVPRGELFDLETINLGFVRPKSSLDWQMAYCQAQLYAQYMLAAYGDDALAKMLAAYRDNLPTREALRRSFGVEQEQFESAYLEYLQQLARQLAPLEKPLEKTFAELQRAQAADPENPDLLARMGQEHLKRKDYAAARRWAGKAIEREPKHQLAHYVLARVHLVIGEVDKAVELLERSLDRDSPQPNALNLLAGLKYKARDYAAAATLYELGAKVEPANSQWTKALARIYLATDDNARLRAALEQLARLDADDVTIRKKLAQLALEASDFAAAADWARQASHIDVMDHEIHRTWAEALAACGDHGAAAGEYATAVKLKPDELELRLAWAQACIDAGQPAAAKMVLEELLDLAPDYPGAETLLEKVTP